MPPEKNNTKTGSSGEYFSLTVHLRQLMYVRRKYTGECFI